MCPSENDGDERVRLRLSRLAGCLQRLLAPHLTAAHISWMARRVLNVDDLLQGRVLLPVTGFRTEDQADVVWERLAIELDVRGVGPGLSYHVGAALGSLTPFVLGRLQDGGMTTGSAMMVCIAVSGLLVAAVVWLGPETRGRQFTATEA